MFIVGICKRAGLILNLNALDTLYIFNVNQSVPKYSHKALAIIIIYFTALFSRHSSSHILFPSDSKIPVPLGIQD